MEQSNLRTRPQTLVRAGAIAQGSVEELQEVELKGEEAPAEEVDET